MSKHIEPEAMAAMVEGNVHGKERQEVVIHLAQCGRCLSQFLNAVQSRYPEKFDDDES